MTRQTTFHDGGPVYLFTNENISGYMPSLGDLTGARVLTVGASGDHVFESYLAGATHVDTFDVNSSQNCVIELKTHMIRELEYEKFMDFFVNKSSFFNTDILRPIQNNFSPELKRFLSMYKYRGNDMFWYKRGFTPSFDVFKISYLQNPHKYYQLREKLPQNINFTKCDIREISAKFTQKYDVILLSNIADYVYGTGIYPPEIILRKFYHDIVSPLSVRNLVPDNGRICCQYIWYAMPFFWEGVIHDFQQDIVQKNNPNHKIKMTRVAGADRESMGDVAIILHQHTR